MQTIFFLNFGPYSSKDKKNSVILPEICFVVLVIYEFMENILKFYYRNLIFYVLCYVHFYITYCIEVFMRERKMFNLKPTKSFKRICVSSLYSLPKNPTWLPKTYLQPHNARLWFPLLFLLKPYIEFPWNQNFLEWIPAHIKPQVKPQSGRRSVLRNRFHFWKYIKV